MTDTVVTVFVEGDTEVDFYKKLISFLREKNGGHLPCRVNVKNVKGVGNYQSKVSRIFLFGVKPQNTDSVHKIVLCYDTDVFQFSRKPPVEWESVVADLTNKGAEEVCLVKAVTSIEDWFLYDVEGLRHFLKMPLRFKLSGYKGLKGLEQLFIKAGRTYIKGAHCKGLVDALDMEVIYPRIKDEVVGLEKMIKGYKVDRGGTKK